MDSPITVMDPTRINAVLARESLVAGDYDDENDFQGDPLDIALDHMINAHGLDTITPSRKPGCASGPR